MVRQHRVPSDAYIYVRKQPVTTTYKKTDGSASQDRIYFAEAFTKTIAELAQRYLMYTARPQTPQAQKTFVSDLPRSATSVVDYDKDTQVV